VASFIALSDDPLLLEALTGAALAGSAVITSPTTDRFIDQLVANGAGIALIDASSVSAPLKGFIATLREQFPQLLLILTGPAALQAQFSAQLADGTIFRFVHKPASSQRLKLFLDAALRQQAVPQEPLARPPVGAAWRTAAPEPPVGGRSSLVLAASLSGAALAAGAIAWAVWHEAAPPAPPKPAQADTAATAAPAAAPQRSEEVSRVSQRDQLAADTQAAQDAAARAAAALEQAQRSALGARADQLGVYLQLARKRLASGALIEPADDSARTYLASAMAIAPEDTEVRATSIALGEALIAQFRHALAAGDGAEAQHWLAACGEYRINSATLNELSAQLTQLQAQQTQADAQARVDSAPTSAPAAPTPAPAPAPAPAPMAAAPVAAAPVAATPPWVSEAALTREHFVPPVYPRDALSRGIGGWVYLEFTVTEDGSVKNVVVLAAEPSGVFDQAACSALAHSRYSPVQRDGVPIAQRTRIRVRFQQ
jgi:TonB family protein